jgi:hypothetical protein
LNATARTSKGQRQIGIIPPKSGVGNDATFGRFVSLTGTDSEKYVKDKKEKVQTKPVIATPFRYTSPTKKPSGSGSVYGCFGKYNYIPETEIPKDVKKPQISTKKNISISPPKETFGTYPYVSPGTREKEKKPPVAVPFRGAGRQGGLFDRNVYRPYKSSERSVDLNEKERPASALQLRSSTGPVKPFRPSSPNKKGWNGTLNPFPSYVSPDEGRSTMRPRSSLASGPVFRPVGRSTFAGPQPSVYFWLPFCFCIFFFFFC